MAGYELVAACRPSRRRPARPASTTATRQGLGPPGPGPARERRETHGLTRMGPYARWYVPDRVGRAGGGVPQPGPRTRFGRASPPPSPDCERYRSPRVLAVSRPRYPDTRPVPGARVDAPRVNEVAAAAHTDRAGTFSSLRGAAGTPQTRYGVVSQAGGHGGVNPASKASRVLPLYCFRRDLRQRGDRSLVTHMSLLSRPGAWRCGGRCRKPVRGHWRVPALDHGRRQHVCVHW